jgi:hypothetical protein
MVCRTVSPVEKNGLATFDLPKLGRRVGTAPVGSKRQVNHQKPHFATGAWSTIAETLLAI